MLVVDLLIVLAFSYLIGSISFSIIFTKIFAGYDIREKGSNNAGTTNVIRNVGWKVGGLTFICDVLKGSVCVLFAYYMTKIMNQNTSALIELSVLGVLIGHKYPIFFGFRGGKGVACAIGAIAIINPLILAILLVFGICIILLTNMVSLASITSAILLPILIFFLQRYETFKYAWYSYLPLSLLIAAFILITHRSNIIRIKEGKENKIIFVKKDNKEEMQEDEN